MLERLASSPPSHLRTRDWMEKLASFCSSACMSSGFGWHPPHAWCIYLDRSWEQRSGLPRAHITHAIVFCGSAVLVAFSSGLILWSLHPTVAIQLPASVHLHMHRLGPLFGRLLSYRAGCASRTRAYLFGTATGGFVRSKSVILMANGGHSGSGRHPSPHASFQSVLGSAGS